MKEAISASANPKWSITFKGGTPNNRPRKSQLSFSFVKTKILLTLQSGNQGRQATHALNITDLEGLLQACQKVIEILEKDKVDEYVYHVHRLIYLYVSIRELTYLKDNPRRYAQQLQFNGPRGGYTSSVRVHLSMDDLHLFLLNLEEARREFYALHPHLSKENIQKEEKKIREDLLDFLELD